MNRLRPTTTRLACLPLLGVAALLLSSLATHAAGDRIWTALVLATNETPPKSAPRQLTDFQKPVQEIFGYNTLYLLGEKKRDIIEGRETWLIPRKNLYLHVRCLDKKSQHYLLQLELYQGKKLLLGSEVKLARDAPLYIRGPQWGKGQLVFILEVI